MKRALLIGGVLILIGVLAAPFVFAPKDEDLIKAALEQSVRASEEGRPGGVLEHLSSALTFNEEGVDRSSVSQYVKMAKPEIEILDPRPTISGNSATIITPVTVALRYGPVQTPVRLDRVVIQLRKETGRRFLILPSPVWRVSSVKVDEQDRALLEN